MNKTRKPYESPNAQPMDMSVVLLNIGSEIKGMFDDETAIGYGGIDSSGSQTPGSRLWGHEDENDDDYDF